MEESTNIGQLLMDTLMQFNKLNMRNKPRFDLRPSELHTFFIIKFLSDKIEKGIKVTDVSKHLGITPPSASQQIKSLEDKGYIIRKHSEEDRRTVLVSLSKEGEKLFTKLKNDMLSRCRDLSEILGEKDSFKLIELLTKTYTFFKNLKEKEES